jgi:hypothetical protein
MHRLPKMMESGTQTTPQSIQPALQHQSVLGEILSPSAQARLIAKNSAEAHDRNVGQRSPALSPRRRRDDAPAMSVQRDDKLAELEKELTALKEQVRLARLCLPCVMSTTRWDCCR